MLTRVQASLVSVVALGIVLGCSSSGEDVFEQEDLCNVYQVHVGESTEPDQPITVRIEGGLGGGDCVFFGGVDCRRIRDRWILRPIQGHASPGSDTCLVPHGWVDTVVTLEPPGIEWVYIEVQSARAVFVESTYVRPQAFLVGTFHYTAYDTLGAEVFWGSLSTTSPEPSYVIGGWEMVIREGLGDGAQTDEGDLYGWFTSGRLDLLLGGPDGISLSGVVDDVGYEGTWAEHSFRGVVNHGTFRAERAF